MDTKLKELISSGALLNDLGPIRGSRIFSDLIGLLSTDKGSHFRVPFKKHFFTFIHAFQPLYPDTLKFDTIDRDWDEGLAFFLSAPQTTSEGLLYPILDNINKKHEEQAMVLIGNAITYANACTFKFVVPKTMRAKESVAYYAPRAVYTDREYAAFVKHKHSLLAAFVSANNKFFDQKILAVMGYILYPYGVGEDT